MKVSDDIAEEMLILCFWN